MIVVSFFRRQPALAGHFELACEATDCVQTVAKVIDQAEKFIETFPRTGY
jgi:hypothetical protein